MIDLHCHILPGLDDGAEDWDESLEMARIASMDGITGVVCTPHYSSAFPGSDRNTVMASVAELRRMFRQSDISIEVYPGTELAIESNLGEKIESGEVLTINDNRKFVLLEMPPDVIPPDLDRLFTALQNRNINVILAHPERNHLLMRNPAMLSEWIVAGILVQITGASLSDRFGKEIGDFARELLVHRMVHFVASDSHGDIIRRPVLSTACEIVESIAGSKESRRIFYELPLKVLSGEIPKTAPPIPMKDKTSFIRRFFFFR